MRQFFLRYRTKVQNATQRQARLSSLLPLVVGMTLATCAALPAHAQQQVYFNNFTGGAGAEWSNSTTATSNGEVFLGAIANGFGAGTDTLTLTGLAAHTSVTVEFDLYIIQTWDGNGQNGGGVDNWQLTANSNNVLFTNFANFTGGNTQAYPNQNAPFGAGGTFAPRTGQSDAGHLGFGTGDGGDATYHFLFNLTDTAPNLSLAFTSFQNQAPGDEGWGLDNVRVSITPTTGTAAPEPGSLALLMPAVGGVGLVLRRRKK